MTRLADYRAAMLRRKAAAAGCTVAELIARSEADAARTRRANDLRYGDRRAAWDAIARRAAAHRRWWVVLTSMLDIV